MTRQTEEMEQNERESAASSVPRSQPIIELRSVGKRFGNAEVLKDVDLIVHDTEVVCVLGDNGAGKSTLIGIVGGLHQHDSGQLLIDGEERRLVSPRQARERGIATLYQDLAVAPLMPVWRNFFLGSELTRGRGPLRRLDVAAMRDITTRQLVEMGIELRDVDQAIGTLSGGERQCVAIARAMYFGARVLILDEPTAALGVKQSALVLRNVRLARQRGAGVILITHNPQQAALVGDQFLLLKRGRTLGAYSRGELDATELATLMAGGDEFAQLAAEFDGA